MAGMNYDDETLEQMQTEAEGRTEVAYPLNDTAYIAEDAQLWHATRTQGVYSADDHLTTRAEGGMQVAVSEGIAWLKKSRFENCVYGNKEEKTLTVETADGRLPRLDRVVIRWDNITNTVKAKLKKGTPATNPQPPTLERNAEAYELGIANVRVPAGALAITQVNIQDTRLDEYACGIMRDGVTGVPTQSLLDNWESWYNEFVVMAEKETNDKKNAFIKLVNQSITEVNQERQDLEEIIEGLVSGARLEYGQYLSFIAELKENAQQDWEKWLKQFEDELLEYPAGEFIERIRNIEKEIISNQPSFSIQYTPMTYPKADIWYLDGGIFAPLEKWGFRNATIKSEMFKYSVDPNGAVSFFLPTGVSGRNWEIEKYDKENYWIATSGELSILVNLKGQIQ